MLQLSQFVWTLRFTVQAVFNNFLLVDPTDRIVISSYQKRLFFAPFYFREYSLRKKYVAKPVLIVR